MKKSVLLFALALAAAILALAQQPSAMASMLSAPRAEVLVLGLYHMDNPGRDIFNSKADDVLAPKRQAEMAELIKVLKKFHPTKIALEFDPRLDGMTKRYAEYLAGTHELTRDEEEQIGFRLAKELGHKTVYGVDADGDFPYQRFMNYAKGNGKTKEVDALNDETGAMVKAKNQYLSSHTILDTLLYMNSDERSAEADGFYYRQAHIGEPGDWAGADLVANWYGRNIRIFSNITHLVDSPNERVLVIFGAGHLGWLRHDIASDPTLRLRKLADFAR